MKKEFGKWLMDIAKYLMTVAILSSIITDMDKTWLYYLSLLFFIVLILVFGLWLIRDKGVLYFNYQDKKEEKNKQSK